MEKMQISQIQSKTPNRLRNAQSVFTSPSTESDFGD